MRVDNLSPYLDDNCAAPENFPLGPSTPGNKLLLKEVHEMWKLGFKVRFNLFLKLFTSVFHRDPFPVRMECRCQRERPVLESRIASFRLY